MKKVVFEISIVKNGGIATPQDIGDITAKIPSGGDFVAIISGRLPVWVYAALTHHLHPAIAVATFDPRLNGGVVVSSHVPELKVGDIIDFSDAQIIKIEV